MTDYRMRNPDLLYAARGKRPMDWRLVMTFGLIGAVVTFGVAGQLAGRFNSATLGSAAARQLAPAAPVQVVAPGTSRTGS